MADWPDDIPLLLKENKQLSQNENFEVDQPYAGTPYIYPVTNDERFFYSGTIIMTKAQYQRFRFFFVEDFNRGITPFTFPVDTGLGTTPTRVTFQAIPDSFRTSSETARTVTINFNCYTDTLV